MVLDLGEPVLYFTETRMFVIRKVGLQMQYREVICKQYWIPALTNAQNTLISNFASYQST
jgi:hypothetical protein